MIIQKIMLVNFKKKYTLPDNIIKDVLFLFIYLSYDF
jgi:hypothetical protein